ncbi:MAG: hypothetical protein HQL42_16000 [Alphaproteobacteria bacterium]|nr:hypothetical protein [Alphaproteobacteria bacterium]
MDHWSTELMWWISAVELPALGGLFWLMWSNRVTCDDRDDQIEDKLAVGLAQLREALSAYKLEVAKSYATTGYLKDVERRLTEHLVRIEAKLDAVQHGGGRP